MFGKVLILILDYGKFWLSQGQLLATRFAGRQSFLLDVNQWALSYMIQRSLQVLEYSWVSKLGKPCNYGLNLEPLDLELKQ